MQLINQVVTTARVALPAMTIDRMTVDLEALKTNSGNTSVYYGQMVVTMLEAGERHTIRNIEDLSKLEVIGTAGDIIVAQW